MDEIVVEQDCGTCKLRTHCKQRDNTCEGCCGCELGELDDNSSEPDTGGAVGVE